LKLEAGLIKKTQLNSPMEQPKTEGRSYGRKAGIQSRIKIRTHLLLILS